MIGLPDGYLPGQTTRANDVPIRMSGFYVQPILLEDFGHSFWVGLDDLI